MKMDAFMDKIAQRFGGQDGIKANSEAEAKQLKKAEERVSELERTVSDMRRLTLKCAETNELTNQLLQGAIERMDEGGSGMGNVKSEEVNSLREELQTIKEELNAYFKSQEENIHKENVRVYRNVQASLVDELKQQTEALALQNQRLERKMRGVKPISIVSIVMSSLSFVVLTATVVLLALRIF